MSRIPKTIDGMGPSTERPGINPKFVLASADLTSEEFFVLSRIDGICTLRELLLMTGLGTQQTIKILRKLHRTGAFLLNGETPDEALARATSTAPKATQAHKNPAPARKQRQNPTANEPQEAPALADKALTQEERKLLAEECALTKKEKLRVLEVLRTLCHNNWFEILGVPRDVDKRALKRAYFRLSKEFHPDRHYNRATGSFGPWLDKIFEKVTKAFEGLSHDRRRAEHIARLDGTPRASTRAAQTPQEHAQMLFERACQLEIAGDSDQALMLFRGSCRVNPSPDYLQRAATCALKAKKFTLAQGFAKQASELSPYNQSVLRLLADVHRAQEQWADAETILLAALAIKSENDSLVTSLQADLADVRRLRGPAPP